MHGQEQTIGFRIPETFREFTGGLDEVAIDAATLREGLYALETRYPQLAQRLRTAQGELQPYIRVFVEGRGVAGADDLDQSLRPGDEVWIICAVAGG